MPWAVSVTLAVLVQRQQQIEDEVDVTKKQTSAQLGADTPKEQPLAEPDPDSLKESYGGNRF